MPPLHGNTRRAIPQGAVIVRQVEFAANNRHEGIGVVFVVRVIAVTSRSGL